jgi:heme exporter protein B
MMVWRQTWAVFTKDLTVEWRTRQAFNAVVFFAVLVLFIFSFALGPQTARQRDLAAGLLWLAFVFTGLLGLGRTFQVEQENHCLEGLILYSRNCTPIYVGKVLATVVFLLSVESMIVVLLAVLYNVDLWRYLPALMLVIGMGTVGFAAVGTLYAAITMQVRAREVLLPLLLLPIMVPVLLASVKATAAVLDGEGLASVTGWVKLLGAFDVVFLTVGWLVCDRVFEP